MTATRRIEPTLLDENQLSVSQAGCAKRLVVLAGAGRGKSEVVCRRIEHLVNSEGLNAADEVVVLSFSRAAVDTIRRRIAGGEHTATAVRTFDSFAATVLNELGEDDVPPGFDARIKRATELLAAGEVPVLVESIRHVIVDEVQDLVGVRAQFVAALLTSIDSDAGFTALGDPLQGIYDFQLARADSHTSDWLRRKLTSDLGADTRTLMNDYRAVGLDAKRVVVAGDDLRSRPLQPSDINLLDTAALELNDVGDIETFAPAILRWKGTTALLTRTNADALRLSRTLLEASVPHTVRRPTEEIGAQPWIATALSKVNQLDLTQSAFNEFLAGAEGAPDPAVAWSLLRAASRRRRAGSRSVPMHSLRAAIKSGALPWELLNDSALPVTVSTVHRAKGLEFDNVILVAGNNYRHPDTKVEDEIRFRYVALSRARNQVLVADLDSPSPACARGQSGRWTERRWQNKRAVTRSIAFGPLDVKSSRPYSSQQTSAGDVQQALAADELVGRSITARLRPERTAENHPIYALLVDDEIEIGRTRAHFGSDLVKEFGSRQRPGRLDGLILAAVESTAGDPDITAEAGIGKSGIWLVPRILGLATPDWRAGVVQ